MKSVSKFEITFDASHHLDPHDRTSVESILKNSFGVSELLEADYHLRAFNNKQLIGYCALKKRKFELEQHDYDLFLLGFVTIEESYRNNGIACRLLRYCIDFSGSVGVTGIILNCGSSVADLYQKVGFTKVCNKASYSREGKIETDEDPVFLYDFTRSISLSENIEDIYFGADF